jgi:putative ABC transport system ATP-binding protein
MAQPVIRIEKLYKEYPIPGGDPFPVLKGVDVEINEGEFVAIMGRSGSGKSTFMNILGTLDRPTGGHYWLNGIDVAQQHDDELARTRNGTIGFVFQSFNLIPRRTVLDNVCMPLMYAGMPHAQRTDIARSYLEMVGLEGYESRLPSQLSGGQQQRVAIARALATNPSLILADEPTGNLDSKTANAIMDLLTLINQSRITIVLVTHELKIAAHAHRIIHFKDGHVLLEERREMEENER